MEAQALRKVERLSTGDRIAHIIASYQKVIDGFQT